MKHCRIKRWNISERGVGNSGNVVCCKHWLLLCVVRRNQSEKKNWKNIYIPWLSVYSRHIRSGWDWWRMTRNRQELTRNDGEWLKVTRSWRTTDAKWQVMTGNDGILLVSIISSLSWWFCFRFRTLEAARCSQFTDIGFSTLVRGCHELQRLDLEECVLITDHTLHSLSYNCPRIVNLVSVMVTTPLHYSGVPDFGKQPILWGDLWFLQLFYSRLRHLIACLALICTLKKWWGPAEINFLGDVKFLASFK